MLYFSAELGVLPDNSKWSRADAVLTGAFALGVEPGAGKRLPQKAGRASMPSKECAGGNSQGHPAGLPGGACAHSQ